MAKVVLPIANGFEEIEAVSIIDILRRCGIEVTIAGTKKRNIVGAHDIEMIADTVVAEAGTAFDAVVLAGGYDNSVALSQDENTQNLLKKMHADGKIVAAICAAPLALSSAGLISGKYTAYPGIEAQIGENYTGNSVEENGQVITSKGPATASEFAFFVASKLVSDAKVAEVKKAMLFS